jgi:hypothetical protein
LSQLHFQQLENSKYFVTIPRFISAHLAFLGPTAFGLCGLSGLAGSSSTSSQSKAMSPPLTTGHALPHPPVASLQARTKRHPLWPPPFKRGPSATPHPSPHISETRCPLCSPPETKEFNGTLTTSCFPHRPPPPLPPPPYKRH